MSTLAHEPHHHQPSASPSVHIHDPDRARHDAAYDRLLADMQNRVDAHTYGDAPAFLVVMPNNTYAHFLDALPPEQRQHHQCRACRDFVNRYAGLVTIQADGSVVSLLWPEMMHYGIYAGAVAVMRRMVESRPIAGAFLAERTELRLGAAPHSDKKRLGHTWTHFSFVVPRSMRCDRSLQNAGQRMAELLEDARMLQRALDEYPAALCRQALELLSNGQLYRSDKCVARAGWLVDLHSAIETHGRCRRAALIWRAVATAPAGFAHVRSGMIGTLLDDLAAAKPFAEIKRAFDSKMSPTQYMRPTAAPTAGAIAQAERTMVELGLAPALARRFAKVEEVDAIWRPAPAPVPPGGGLFAHLLPTSPSRPGVVDATATVSMTFAKFRATVLPKAEAIELQVPYGRAGFSALVTAVNPDAPPILRWDHPVSNYCYASGSDAATWNLAAGAWAKVTAITLDPGRWYGHEAGPHGSDRAFFLLQGAYDKRHTAGGGFFPEQLRGELHAVRSVLEAHANQAPISGRTEAEATACGLVVPSPGSAPLVRVTAAGVRTTYRIDRWD